MEYYENSGSDDDNHPGHQNRVRRGTRVACNEMPPGSRSASFSRRHAETDLQTQVHQLEQDAYSAVLKAFKAQSDAITWEKESLITELRKELNLSNEEHRELLAQVNKDDVIQRIRECKQGVGYQGFHEPSQSPTLSVSRKKPKMAISGPSQSYAAPPLLYPQTVSASHQPSTTKRGVFPGARGKKHKLYHSSPPGGMNQGVGESAEGATLVGRRVRTRWPDDNNFYEAVISDYNPVEGRHALVYDMNTPNQAWEWVNLSEISPSDIQWVAEDPVISRQRGYGGTGREINRVVGHGTGRSRSVAKGQFKKDSLPPPNGSGRNGSDDITLLHTDSLVEEVQRIFNSDHPDPVEMETAKKNLKDHEQALIDAINKLGYISDGESDDGGNEFTLAGCMERG